MVIRQASGSDYQFIDDMLNIAIKKPSMGIGYPGGSLEDIQQELLHIGKSINDSLFVVEKDCLPIGIIGIYDAPWGLYLIGPTFSSEHHNLENITKIIPTFFDLIRLREKTVIVDAKESNTAMINALTRLNFDHVYSGISMQLDISRCALRTYTQ